LTLEEEAKSAGVYLYQQGQYRPALTKFLLTDPADGQALLYKSFCYTRLSLYEQAESILVNLESDGMESEETMQAMMALGYIYVQMHEWDKADDLFKLMNEETNENAQFFSLWGYTAQAQGNYTVAVKRFSKAIELEASNANALNSLAYLYTIINDEEKLEEGLAYARRAVSISPDNASYLDTLGWICLKLNKTTEALNYLNRALALRGHDATIKEHLEAARFAVKR
jgi:tetratricopeptide (TPR) repeat protein